MKKIILIISGFFFLLKGSHAQSPGGVKEPNHWLTTFKDASGAYFQSNVAPHKDMFPLINSKKTIRALNSHDANYFDGTTICSIPLSAVVLKHATIFTIYHSADPNKESTVWDIADDSVTNLVLSTHRFADLNELRYTNFTDAFPLHPKLSVVLHQRAAKPPTSDTAFLHIGRKPLNPTIPTQSFKGSIAELVIYNRSLSWEEILKVSSYLSLKYGITLSEPDATYLNSQGQVIWSGYDYTDYHHNISGIIRDDSSGLKQLSATSSNQPQLLSISTNDSLNNLTSLVWGNNDQPLSPEEKRPGLPQMLQKKWLIVGHTINHKVTTTLDIDTKLMDIELPAKPTYWLVVDKSGNGNFEPHSCDYIKMSELTSEKIARFHKVSWGSDSVSKTIFGFVAGPNFLIATSITEPSCSSRTAGEMNIRIRGASFPCKLSVYEAIGKTTRQISVPDTGLVTLTNIAAGKYYITGIDNLGNFYKDSFYVNYADAPKPPSIQSVYEIKELQILAIDASENMPPGASYEWVGPNNFSSTQSKINLQHPGIYVLTTIVNGCSYVQEVLVKRPPQPVFKKIIVYPNPSRGPVTIQIFLEKATHVRMDIVTEDGRLIRSRDLSGLANYNITEQFDYQGIYFLVFRSDADIATKKVEVIQ